MDEQQIRLNLTNTPNLLSKRLTPQRDELKLTRAPRKNQWSAREIVAHLRDTEARIFPKLYLIAVEDNPDKLVILALKPGNPSDPKHSDITSVLVSDPEHLDRLYAAGWKARRPNSRCRRRPSANTSASSAPMAAPMTTRSSSSWSLRS